MSAVDIAIKEALRSLSEHCDSVQIFVEFTENRETHRLQEGRGSTYARVGMAREYVLMDEARINFWIKKTEFPDV